MHDMSICNMFRIAHLYLLIDGFGLRLEACATLNLLLLWVWSWFGSIGGSLGQARLTFVIALNHTGW
jgi:hypothetical protein